MTLEELLVRIKVENKQAVRGLDEAKKAADQATGRFDGLRSKLAELSRALGKKPKAEVARGLERGLKAADRAIAQTERKIQSLQRVASKTTKSEEFKTVEQDLKAAESALTKAAVARDKAREKWEKAGGTNASTWTDKNIKAKAQFEEANAEYIETRREIIRLQDELARLKEEGSHISQTDSARAAEVQLQAERANLERLKRFRESLNANLEGTVSNPALQRLQAFLSGVRKAGSGIKSFATKSVRALKGVVSWIEKMGRGFGTVLSKIPLLNRIPKTLNKIKRGLFMGSGMRSLIRLGAAGFLVYRAVQMMREGFKNLAQYSGQTNSDISMLMGSLNTLKNALATAFAPILTAVAPALNYLIQLLIKAATAVAHFTAAFTGKSTVVVAKQQTADYAASLGDAADAAGSANDAAKEYQKTLLGFDQMNVLNDTDKSSGSGGSGGGGAGAGGVGDMFETVEVGSGAKSLADRIKESWKNADFTDLGRDLGNKIAEELNKIPWEKLQNIAYKLGKSIATGFNGLNDSEFWGSLGHAVAESLNTILTGIEGFVSNFDWTKAGRALADGINHLFLDFDWKKLGRTFSEGAKGLLEAFRSLFDDIKWEDIGKSVMSAIASVDWIGIIVDGIRAAGSLANGILGFIKGAFEQAAIEVSEWISSGKMWEDIKSLGKATFDVGINLVGAAWTTIETALNGIWNIVASIGEKLGITRSFGAGATSAVSEDDGIKGRTIKGIIPSVFKEISNTPAFAWTKGIVGVVKLIPGLKNLFENDDVSFSKELGDIWKDIKKTFSGFDKKVQKAGKEGKLNASVIGAFGKNPFSKGSLFGSLNGTGAQVKIKTLAELTGIKDKIPTTKKSVGNMLAVLSRKNETFVKTTGNMTASLGSKWEGFSHTSSNMTASLGSKWEGFAHTSNNMTASLGSKSEGFSHTSNAMTAWLKGKSEGFSHWSNEMKAWLKTKSEGFSHWTNAMTARIDSISFGSRARQIVLNAYTRHATGGLYRNGKWQPITAAANGGSFTTGQMFVAREDGPELVGRIGSGTSVMNNDQIVASVSAGVAKGAYEAFVSAMRDTGGNGTQVVLEGDAAKMFRVVQRQAVQYMNSTGQAPFPV